MRANRSLSIYFWNSACYWGLEEDKLYIESTLFERTRMSCASLCATLENVFLFSSVMFNTICIERLQTRPLVLDRVLWRGLLVCRGMLHHHSRLCYHHHVGCLWKYSHNVSLFNKCCYYMALSHRDWELPNSRIWLAEIDIDRGLDFPI